MLKRQKRTWPHRQCGAGIDESSFPLRAHHIWHRIYGQSKMIGRRMPKDHSLVPGGAALFQRLFTRLGCSGRPPRFRVEFYPYSSLVLTLRHRQEIVHVRFSDLLRRAPLAVLEAAAALLLCRVYRRKAPAALT